MAMKRLFFSLAAFLLLATQAHAEVSAQRLYTAEGVISSVDSGQVVLRTHEGTLDFDLNGSVHIFRDGQRVSAESLQPGEHARATYQESRDGVLDDEVLVRLELTSSEEPEP
ncbi:hypothetical protein [Vitiosangium sp. GDMCC 1.1324]|uniref:hypothetical protein n=1 Tax=Vitiosangium sp. (strain GDMCC 1.1324) TaxID=2138576 RepID=UPI000D37C82E|nr:hypothetical protein [Vitiosangium sp. GDMCC 1.1324]PTL77114.1 hypothetical protein DAT35_46610 [Vitiosangium sp. GDMCC 1.1324]